MAEEAVQPSWKGRFTLRPDFYTKVILAAIALSLGLMALRPLVEPQPISAQTSPRRPFLRFDEGLSKIASPDGSLVVGRVAVDLNTGYIYGFPTDPLGYPRNPAKGELAVSDPILLGRFNLDRLPQQPNRSSE